MEYQATAKYVRVSTRKVRLIADSIRKISPERALFMLRELPNHAAVPLAGVIESALANAKQKMADSEGLMFKEIDVMGGPVMKRWHAASRGQAHGYKKRMTHIRVVLADMNAVKEGKQEAGGK